MCLNYMLSSWRERKTPDISFTQSPFWLLVRIFSNFIVVSESTYNLWGHNLLNLWWNLHFAMETVLNASSCNSNSKINQANNTQLQWVYTKHIFYNQCKSTTVIGAINFLCGKKIATLLSCKSVWFDPLGMFKLALLMM